MAQRIATGTFLQGWALAAQGRGEDGLAQMRQGLASYRATGTVLELPWYLGVLAETCGSTGRVEEGLDTIAEALRVADNTGYYVAELYRLQGELLLAQASNGPQWFEVEASLQQALDVARRQQARSLELRAAMSLAGLWQQQGKRTEAYALLAPIYVWFTEGWDTADLQEAKALLAALA
jgi:predicted ATPase